jgi:hypothetical protein
MRQARRPYDYTVSGLWVLLTQSTAPPVEVRERALVWTIRPGKEPTMSRKPLIATLVTLGSTLAAFHADAQLSTGERSRNDATLEVVSGSKIYKHAIGTLNRTDNDTYAGTSLIRPAWTPSERFYTVGNEIRRIGNSNDTMTTWTTFSPPTSPAGDQMTVSTLTKCGNRLCLIFTSGCRYWQIFSWDLVTKSWAMGPLQSAEFQCVRDATDDIWNPDGGFVALLQSVPGSGVPWAALIARYSPTGTYLTARDVGTPSDWTDRIAQAIAPNRVDGSTLYVLDTNYQDSIIKRVRVSDGAVVGTKFYARAGFSHHDLAYVDSGRNLVLIGTDWNTQYNVITFDDQNLNVRQDRLFTF